ncbi:MAG: hypothetical protein DMD91_18735 [Candidatus Rokuibacteriota bacterium]|nr:MAG: hypothetical protein DMD91_18735 [Candidatus Rokubacteria bacterium]
MRARGSLVLGLIVLFGGCAIADPRPVYQTSTSASAGTMMLVVGVERDLDNAYTVRTLARELAFSLAHRGRSAIDLGTFLQQASLRGIVVPPIVVARLTGGGADGDIEAWLRAERITTIVFLDVAISEQVWGERGKRTRVGLTARGRTLDQGDETWRAYTTPDVEDEPGQGFQIATETALGALARVIVGEPEPAALPRPSTLLPNLRLRW